MKTAFALAVAAMTLGWSAGAAAAETRAPRVVELPMHGNLDATPHMLKLPNGTTLVNTSFFSSEKSDVSVGRTFLDGPELHEKTNYTDVFMVVHGSGDGSFNGQPLKLNLGDVVLMPKGSVFDSKNIKQYIHFFASFERRPDASFNGPAEVRVLRPTELPARDFQAKDGILSHTYYEGSAGVRVEAERFRNINDAQAQTAADSRLLFITSGSGTIRNSDGSVVRLKPHTAVLVEKGASFQRAIRNLSAVTVIFDQDD